MVYTERKCPTCRHAVRLGLRRQRAVMQIFDDGSTREFSSLVEAQRVKYMEGLRAHARGSTSISQYHMTVER
jgi:hypothetical protein